MNVQGQTGMIMMSCRSVASLLPQYFTRGMPKQVTLPMVVVTKIAVCIWSTSLERRCGSDNKCCSFVHTVEKGILEFCFKVSTAFTASLVLLV